MSLSLEFLIFLLNAVFLIAKGQQYDFAAEITRQCLVPDPVGLLDCVENKVDLPYLSSWVDCTNSLGEHVATSSDIINYRCKSVWEGKGVIPQVFYIKDCVIERTGLPAKEVSAKVLGAYKVVCALNFIQFGRDFHNVAIFTNECEKPGPGTGGNAVKRTKSDSAPGNVLQRSLPTALLAPSYQSSTVQYAGPTSGQASVLPTNPSIRPAAVNQRNTQQQQSSEYDFAAEISRQCLVPDPVGLLDCVENKVDLPYMTSWVECTNSLGQNVTTSVDIINYRCKSVWEGKGAIPEVFYIKDCVIEKTGLPAKDVSAKVLGAYKECERNPPGSQQSNQRIKGLSAPAVSYRPQQQFGQRTSPLNTQQQQTSEYDFGAEIARQCRVPDPVGLLDCVENKVNLPYLTSWVSCTNSLGENVATSADVINYRCKSVWEGKAVIPEVFWIKDCVIEKTGLPAKNVSAEVLGAYKECEKSTPKSGQKQNQQSKSYQAQVNIQQRLPMGVQAPVLKASYGPATTRQYFMIYPMQAVVPRSQVGSQNKGSNGRKTPVSSTVGQVSVQHYKQQQQQQQQQPVIAQQPIQKQFTQKSVQQQYAQKPIQQQFAQKPIQQQFAQKPTQQQFVQKPTQQQFAQKPLQQQFAQNPIQQQFAQNPIQQQFAQKPIQQQFAQKPTQQQFAQKPLQQQFAQNPIQQQFAQKPIQQQFAQKPIQQQFAQKPIQQQFAQKPIQQQFAQKPIQQQFAQKSVQQQRQLPQPQFIQQKPVKVQSPVILQQSISGQYKQPNAQNPSLQQPFPNAHYYSFITTHDVKKKDAAY